MKADRIIRDLNHSSKKHCFHKTVFAQQMLILKAHAVISAASGLITFTFPEGGQQQTRLFLILKSCSTYLLTHCNLYCVILTVWQLADNFSLLRLQWPSLFCIYSNTHSLPKTHNTLSYPALITRRRTQWRTLNVLCLMVPGCCQEQESLGSPTSGNRTCTVMECFPSAPCHLFYFIIKTLGHPSSGVGISRESEAECVCWYQRSYCGAITKQGVEIASLKKSLGNSLDLIELSLSSLQKTMKRINYIDKDLSTSDNRITILEATCNKLQVGNGLLRAKVNDLEGHSITAAG